MDEELFTHPTSAIVTELSACLFDVLAVKRIDTREWRKLLDPFPIWVKEAA